MGSMIAKTFRRPAPGEIPDQPGVYLFKDVHGKVIYVASHARDSSSGMYFFVRHDWE